MSKYFTIYRKSSSTSGTEEIRSLWSVLRYVWKTYHGGHKTLSSKYTLTIKEHDHYEDVERREYKRLHKIYGEKK